MPSDSASMEYALLGTGDSGPRNESASAIHLTALTSQDAHHVPVREHLFIEEPHSKAATPARRFWSLSAFSQLFIDLLLASSAVVFLIFAYLVQHHEGRQMDIPPVPALRAAARYGPTIFPIAFTAVVANCLKTISAWKLERGITVLSLEYLLGSRTVFSAVTTPLKLRSPSTLIPLLVSLWALSPLGGQAALRVVETLPTTASTSMPVSHLEFKSELQNTGSNGPAADITLPAAVGAFSAALSSPRLVKLAGQDIYGNVKIPLWEYFESISAQGSADGWYNVQDFPNVTYASILGLPIKGYSMGTNLTFEMQTSYLYTTCRVSHDDNFNFASRLQYMANRSYLASNGTYSNVRSLIIEVGHLPLHFAPMGVLAYDPTPMELLFTSFNTGGVTNSSCSVTTSHVEVEVFCHNTNCTVNRIRRSTLGDATAIPTVLDFDFVTRTSKTLTPVWFFDSFVNATDTPWSYKWVTQFRSSPLEIYFTEQHNPYSVSTDGDVIWPIGDTLFSHRFSQLLNAWWIANIAPFAIAGNFLPLDTPQPSYRYQNISGNMTPDTLVLHCQHTWLIVLVIASLTMLFAGILAAALGALRKGPDILDYSASLLRDSLFVNVKPLQSTQGAIEHARKLKDVTVVVGDARPEQMVGRMAIGTTDAVRAASKLETTRLYY
jgi:hypothetical protein